MSGALSVRAEIDVDATIERAWDAWTTREGLRGWLVDDLEGEVAAGNRIGWTWRDLGLTGTLDVVAADAPRRLTLAQHRPGAPADVIEVMLGQREGRTTVRVSQTGFVTADPEPEAESVSSGWRIALHLLRERLERHPEAPRASVLRTRATGLALTQVVPWMLTRGGRAAWLPPEARGEPRLLTTREALLAWPEVDGLLEAKVYPGGPRQTIVALRAHSWSAPRAELERHVASFDAALEKLESLAAGKR